GDRRIGDAVRPRRQGRPGPSARGQPHTPAQRREDDMNSPRLEYTAELLRHFADLRDGSHGGATSRREKERLFTAAVALLDPYARQPLEEINADLLLGTGVDAIWALSWPEQQAGAVQPVMIRAYYGVGAHHPHLQAGTAGDWPLNVFDAEQAAAELPTLRAAASADLHNLVFRRDYRIIPAIVNGWAHRQHA